MQRHLTGGCTPAQWAGLGEMRPNSPSASDRLSWGRFFFFSVNRIIIGKCMKKNKNIQGLGALIYAGAGIVEGTVSSSEWEEVELKASQVPLSLSFLAFSLCLDGIIYLRFILLCSSQSCSRARR